MIYSAKQMPSEAAAREGPMAPGMLEMALKVPAFERVPREQDIPMSIAQERLWLASQFDDSAARYSITVAVRLQSEPDEGALRESARALVARHDALRTVFQFKDGLACQTVRPDAEYEFSRYDFGHMSLLEQKRGLQKVLSVESTRPFNLQSGPLCRMALIKLGVPLVRAFDAGRDYLLILEDEYALKNFNPQAAGVQALDKIGCIISSPSASSTAAFRFFAPRVGIQEDRASGSVIPALVAYWGGDRSGSYVFSQESGHNIQIQARQFGDRIGVSGEVLRFASGKLGRIPVTSSLASSFTFQSAR
jgi:hypothetical protein